MQALAMPEIRVFPSLEELSRGSARRFEELANLCVAQKQTFSAALSGGSTPKRLYEMLASPSYRVPWERVHLFQVDERCVPPDHEESNYRMIREALLDHVSLPPTNYHRIAAENPDRDEAARKYAEEIRQIMELPAGEFPRLDLVFLGMGADGHTASLFPDSAALDERVLWVRPSFSENLGKWRLTMTYPVLNAAAEIIFQVAGTDKAETLREVIEGPSRPVDLPAQGVCPTNGKLVWYVDQAAARLLAR